MNQDRLKGTLDEVVGTIKRKAGELTHDTPLQAEGIAQQVKGKFENTWGKAKDAVREAVAEASKDRMQAETESEYLASETNRSKDAEHLTRTMEFIQARFGHDLEAMTLTVPLRFASDSGEM